MRDEQLAQIVKQLEEFLLLQPSHYELSYLSTLCNKSRDTMRKHLITNYKDGLDYFQKKSNGKIFIQKATAINIRRYYER